MAVAAVDGPAVALAVVDDLDRDGRLADYPYLPAVRAELPHRMGRRAEAAAAKAYRAALARPGNAAERAFLADRLHAEESAQ